MAFLTQNETKTSGFLRDKERFSKKFQTNFEAIIAKYDRPFVESDVLDLNNLTVVEDRGFLSRKEKSRIGTAKLATDKVSPHKATRWDSTKDSTDSAFGSTRLSESEDTSGTETIVNYTYQHPPHVIEEESEQTVLRMDDVLMSRNSHSEDSGNEDVESDHSGPICTPTRSSLNTLMHHQGNRDTPSDSIHRRARGNLSKKFEEEHRVKEKKEREIIKELSANYEEEEEEEEEEEDPYEFKILHHQGNGDTPSDSIHRRARGNLSKKFEDEHRVNEKKEREMFKELSENYDEEEEEEEDDPYEFKDELPSLLEERNRFLFKIQSILADSFSDGDGMDEMDSLSDGEASTGTVESSEATSGSISAWSTLQSRPTPKRTSKSDGTPRHDKDERLLDGLRITSADSDYTECSTILAGNLHTDRRLFGPSNLLSRSIRNRDSTSNMSQPPFEAICNSTMLSEIEPPALETAKRKPHLDSDRHRELELPLDGQGEVCLGEVPFNAQCKPKVKSESFDSDQIKSPKSKRSLVYRTPVKYDDTKRKSSNISMKSNTPTTRNHNRHDSIMSPGDCNVSGITPRARLQKAVKVNRKASLSTPRFDTQEIIEIFRSPKPLIIPGINVDSLDLTPRRRVKREGVGALAGTHQTALLRLQIPSSSEEEKSTDHRTQTAKEIITDSACEMTLDCTSFDSESSDDQRSETLVSKSNVCSDDRPNQIARTPKTPGVVETASVRKHQREVVEAAKIARPEVCRSNRRLKEGTRELKTSASIRKDNSVSKGIPTCTGQTHTSSNESLNVTEQQGKHSEVCGAELGVTDSQVGQTALHHRSSQSTDAPELNTVMNSVSPKLDSQRTQDSTKYDTRRKGSERKLSKHKQVPVRSDNNTGKKSTQKSRLPVEISTEDVQDSPMNRSPLPSKTPKVKRSILTPTVQRSPSTLSSPLNRMSLASPQACNGPVKGQLPKGSDKKTSVEQAVKKKQKNLSEGHPKSRHTAENFRLKDRRRTEEEFNSTHVTIRDFDDDSEDEMEVDVDPYSLTADDSSPGPSHFRRRRTAYTNGKPAPLGYNGRRGNNTSGKGKLRSSLTGANHLSQKFQEHDGDLDRVTPTKRYRHPRQSESYQKDLRNSENDREFGQSSAVHSKKVNVLANKTAVLNSAAASLPVKNNSRTALIHGERKLVARAEHTLYFSDEESNSSGDSAKFLSLVPNHSPIKTCDSDPAGVPVAVPEDNKRNHVDRVGSYKTKHKTIIRCGQIISSPKSAKSLSRNLHTSSPPRTGRVEKSRKMYANSPTRSFQSDTKSVRSSTKVNQRGQPAKTVARRLIASPMKKLDDHANSDNVRSLVSSPLCSSGCNVSSSYTCEGPGHCTKPFCFSCALSELS